MRILSEMLVKIKNFDAIQNFFNFNCVIFAVGLFVDDFGECLQVFRRKFALTANITRENVLLGDLSRGGGQTVSLMRARDIFCVSVDHALTNTARVDPLAMFFDLIQNQDVGRRKKKILARKSRLRGFQ